MRYQTLTHNKRNGVVYTPRKMADYVAREMIRYKKWENDVNHYSVIDPAAGDGELLIALIQKLLPYNKSLKVVGYETDQVVANCTQQRLHELYPDINCEIRCADFLQEAESNRVEKYDFVIANPPYIRTQILGAQRVQKIVTDLSLTGRIDIYYAFLLYTKKIMKSSGIAGYITSNKFMTIKAGTVVRKYMLDNYNLYRICDFGDTKLFSASVLPCVMIFSLGKTEDNRLVQFTSIYEQKEKKTEENRISNIFDVIYQSGNYQITDGRNYQIHQGWLKISGQDSLWTITSARNEQWLAQVRKNTWGNFSLLGKVRVGIKTTADNVFIGDDWNGEKAELELLRPLITHRNAGQIVANKNFKWQVLYPHTVINGKRVVYDINKYPKTKAYLLQHYEQLAGRKYIAKAKRKWYEIWVPQNPSAWAHRKIVFRDISEKPQFWFDKTGAIVNGDCYWIDIKENIPDDIIYLALAVANSSFIEKYYDCCFNTKLYSGKRRFQTQYVEQFPIPNPNSELAKYAIGLVKKIIADNTDNTASYKQKIDKIVNELFNPKNSSVKEFATSCSPNAKQIFCLMTLDLLLRGNPNKDSPIKEFFKIRSNVNVGIYNLLLYGEIES